MKKILISGYHGFNNLGDEAILESILQILKQAASKKGHALAITVLSANPEKTVQNYADIKAISRTNLPLIISAIKNCDLFLSGGGSLLQDKTGYGLSTAYYLGLVFLARLFRKKIVLYAQGIGPITKKINRLLARWIINNADLVTVRDTASKKELLSMGIIRPPLRVTVDPAFCLQPSSSNTPQKAQNILSHSHLPPGKPLLGISVRSWQGERKFIHEIAKAADRLALALGTTTIFIPMFPKQDLPVSRYAASLMQQEAHVLEKELTPQEALFIFSRLDLLIGVRLHSLIFAAITGTPMVGIGYDPKVRSFINQLELNPIHKIESLQAGELFDHCLQVWREREIIKDKLQQTAAEYYRKSNSFGESVYRYFFGQEGQEGNRDALQ
ncbi:MAG: polysaccharide pyruvyl transferase CsaB [Peptococcaceae bacterium]|nr:polysaccharide pyruvyl transferase CsaB [Peptococcaceae bacterium]